MNKENEMYVSLINQQNITLRAHQKHLDSNITKRKVQKLKPHRPSTERPSDISTLINLRHLKLDNEITNKTNN